MSETQLSEAPKSETMRHIKLDKGADGVATLTLDNADESMNVVSEEWLDNMNAAIAELRDDESVTGVIIASGKPAFMAGADLKADGRRLRDHVPQGRLCVQPEGERDAPRARDHGQARGLRHQRPGAGRRVRAGAGLPLSRAGG